MAQRMCMPFAHCFETLVGTHSMIWLMLDSFDDRMVPSVVRKMQGCLPALLDTPKCAIHIGFDLCIFTQVWQTIYHQHHRIQDAGDLHNKTDTLRHTRGYHQCQISSRTQCMVAQHANGHRMKIHKDSHIICGVERLCGAQLSTSSTCCTEHPSWQASGVLPANYFYTGANRKEW